MNNLPDLPNELSEKRPSRRACLTSWPLALAAGSLAIGADAQSPGRIKIIGDADGRGKYNVDLRGLSASRGSVEGRFWGTLQNALEISGWFTFDQTGGANARLTGSLTGNAARLRLASIDGSQSASAAKGIDVNTAQTAAYQVADQLIQGFTGKPGMFSAKLAWVSNANGKKEVWTGNALGQNFRQITREGATCLAPTWHPTQNSVYYTSYAGGFPSIRKLDLAAGRWEKVIQFGGTNLNGTVSPDGRSLSLVLSKDGRPEIYTVDLGSKRLTRLTRSRQNAPKSSPSWSPDGSQLVYVSGENGQPHLYTLSRTGGSPRRLTRPGSVENVSPDWGPSGIVYSERVGRQYRVKVIPNGGGAVVDITPKDYASYEEPCWAADGRHVYVSRTKGYRSKLYLLDTLGDDAIDLTKNNSGDWYSPSCSG